MKFRNNVSMLAGSLALLLCACEEETRVVVVEATPTPAATPKLGVASTPVARPAATPANVKKKLYLARRISITNDAGIFGFPPGTEIEIVSRKGDTLVVRAKDMQIEVKQSDTTENFQQIAAASQQADNQRRAQQAQLQQQKKAYAQQMAVAAQAADQAKRQRLIDQINQQIVGLNAQRDRVVQQLSSSARDPNATPEGQSRLAELKRIDNTVRQLYAQIGQIRRAK
jgi:hypothetical protein